MTQRKRALNPLWVLLVVLNLLAIDACSHTVYADDTQPSPTPTCIPDDCTAPDGGGGGRHTGG